MAAPRIVKVGMLILSAFAGVAIVSFFRNTGIGDLQAARKRVAALHADIARGEAENVRLRAEIDSVRRSTFAVERIAREDLGMSKRGEIVYMLPKTQR
ncbi:MAG TPA: septum formation initiator family protein [Thermoanaerobaculia bacterium]|nr:septum formation initiator family protein [Thermoanaerobaculia bacterium]